MFKNLKEIIFCFFTFLILEYGYVYYVIESFSYVGFNSNFNNKIFYNFLLYIIVFFSSYLINQERNSDFIKITLYFNLIFFLFPSLILYKYSHDNQLIVFSYLALFLFLYIFLNYIKISFVSSTFNIETSKYLILFLSIFLFIPFFISYGLNFDINTILLADIYETREDFSSKSNIYLDYTYSLLSKFIAPIGLVFSLIKNNKLLSLLFTLIIIYMFLITGHKLILFGYFSILFFYFLNKNERFIYILISLNLLLLSSIIIFQMLDIPIIPSLIIRRVFFLPSLLDVYYFDFFQNNSINYSHSFFSSIFNYPYFQSPKDLISINYFNDFNMSANNGLISDGYMNLGLFGILLNLILFSCIMTFIKSLNISMKFYGIVFLFIFSALSSPLSTIMVTHGGFILLIILNFTIKNTNAD